MGSEVQFGGAGPGTWLRAGLTRIGFAAGATDLELAIVPEGL